MAFRAVARRGMPQGSPESPMLCTALVEYLLERAEQRLLIAQRPAGVRLDLKGERSHQLGLTKVKQPFGPKPEVYMNVADATHVLGADVVDLSYSTSVLAQELRTADQLLNSGKCELLTSEEETDEDALVRVWSDAEVEQYIVSVSPPTLFRAEHDAQCFLDRRFGLPCFVRCGSVGSCQSPDCLCMEQVAGDTPTVATEWSASQTSLLTLANSGCSHTVVGA